MLSKNIFLFVSFLFFMMGYVLCKKIKSDSIVFVPKDTRMLSFTKVLGVRGGVCENDSCANNKLGLDYKADQAGVFEKHLLDGGLEIVNNQLIIKKKLQDFFFNLSESFSLPGDLIALVGIPVILNNKNIIEIKITQQIKPLLPMSWGIQSSVGTRIELTGLGNFKNRKDTSIAIKSENAQMKTYYLVLRISIRDIQSFLEQLNNNIPLFFEISAVAGKEKGEKTLQIVLEK